MQFLMNFNKVFSRPNEKKLGLTKGDKGSQVFFIYLFLSRFKAIFTRVKTRKMCKTGFIQVA